MDFHADVRLTAETARHAVTKQRATKTATAWTKLWIPFLSDLGIHDPLLTGVRDKIPLLRVFAQRIRDGRCSRSGRPIKTAGVRDEILHVAKTFAELGAPDPRLTIPGDMDPRLTSLYRAWANQDPAPVRVKPIPIQIIHRAQAWVTLAPTPTDQATIDMIWIAYFFLLRPGEYCLSSDNKPLTLRSVGLLIGTRRLNPLTDAADDLFRATHVSITFDNQKNRERGEVVGHARSQHSLACPVLAAVRRVLAVRAFNAAPTAPLCSFRTHRTMHVTSHMCTTMLRAACSSIPHLGFDPSNIEARSLRSGGAMALLCGGIDKNVIQLVGHWKSDAMFRYLHAQALPLVRDLSRVMLRHGAFALLPAADVPPQAAALLHAYADPPPPGP